MWLKENNVFVDKILCVLTLRCPSKLLMTVMGASFINTSHCDAAYNVICQFSLLPSACILR